MQESMRTALVAALAAALTNVAAARVVVDTTADTPDANPGDGVCADADGNVSLRAAIQEANAGGIDEIIELDAGETYVLTIDGAGEDGAATGDLDISTTILIRGEGATVDANGLDRAFDVHPDGRLRAWNLRVINGESDGGGAYRNRGVLIMYNSAVMLSAATGAGAAGGAILNDGGTMVIIGSTITANSAVRAGGGIEVDGGLTRITGSVIAGNDAGSAPGNGGGLHVTGGGEVLIHDTTVAGNDAASDGGGLWNAPAGDMTIAASVIAGNIAGASGGGIFNAGGALTIHGTIVRGNDAAGADGTGGGVRNAAGDMLIVQSKIVANGAVRAGGGIAAIGGTSSLRHTGVMNNIAGGDVGLGGGLHVDGAATMTILDGRLSANTARTSGGAIWTGADATTTIVRALIAGNLADGDEADEGGGGIYNDGGTLVMEHGSVRNNGADGEAGSGGGIFNAGGDAEIVGTRIVANRAIRAGGGIEALAGFTALDDVALVANTAAAGPGNGGGLHLTGDGEVLIDDSAVLLNKAAFQGGGLWNSATGTMLVNNTLFLGNDAPFGPEVWNDGGTFIVDGSAVPAP